MSEDGVLGVAGLEAGFLGAEGLGAGLVVVRGGAGSCGFSTSFMSSVSERWDSTARRRRGGEGHTSGSVWTVPSVEVR